MEGGLTCPHEEPSVPLWRKLQPPPTQRGLNMLLKHQLTSYHQKQDEEEEREWRRSSHEELTDVVGVMSATYCLYRTDATRNDVTQQISASIPPYKQTHPLTHGDKHTHIYIHTHTSLLYSDEHHRNMMMTSRDGH